jgi:RimJ/RimL family protein N-acetyltransferase
VPSLPLPDPPLADEAVRLRPFTLDDVAAVTAALADREVSRWTATIPWPYHEVHARGWIGSHEDARAAGEALDLAIVAAGANEPAGAVGLNRFDWNRRSANIGYWVARPLRGRGLATRATVLLSSWALARLGLRSLQLLTIVGNVASERVAEKAGFAVAELLPAHDLGERREDVKRWTRGGADA